MLVSKTVGRHGRIHGVFPKQACRKLPFWERLKEQGVIFRDDSPQIFPAILSVSGQLASFKVISAKDLNALAIDFRLSFAAVVEAGV